MNPIDLLITIVLGYLFLLAEEFEGSAWISVSSILLSALVTIPLSILIFRRNTSLVAFTFVTSVQLFITAVLRVSLVYGGFVSHLRGVDAFGMLGLNVGTYVIFAISGIIPAHYIRKYDPGPGFRVFPIVLSSLGVLYTYTLSSGYWSSITTLNGLLLFSAELTAPAVYAFLGIWTARYWSRSYRGIGRRHKSKGVVLMLASGWVYKWDTYSATLLGGNGRANDLAVHEGILYEAEPAGVISWQTQEFLPTASKGWATSICSHAGRLYHAITTGPSATDRSMIFETLTGKLIAERDYSVTTLCSHDGRLYDGGACGVYDTFANRVVTDRPVHVLCSHGGKLYDGGFTGVHETISGTEIAYRQRDVFAICSYRGILYDATQYGAVFDTMTNLVVLDYRYIIHKTKSRIVMGFKLKGGRHEVHTVARMVPADAEIVKRFEGALRDFKEAIGR